jgi:hypothetical protein
MQPQLPRPIGVILLTLNYLLIGCFGTLFLPIFIWVFPPAIHQLVSQVIHPPALSMLVTCVAVFIWVGGYVLYAAIGYGMFKLRLWSLKAAVATHWFAIALTLIAVVIEAKFDWMLAVSSGAFCLLGFGGILYYLQRRRVRWPFEAATAIAKRQPIPPQPPASTIATWKIVTCVATVVILGVAVFVVGLFASIERSFKSSTAYAMALDRAQSSPCIARTFAQPIVAKGFISGNLNTRGDSGEADFEIPIHGPKTSGNLHVEAKKSAGSWTISSLTAEHSEGQIQLAPTPCD